MPTDMPAPPTTCDWFESEVRRYMATVVTRPVEVEVQTQTTSEPEPQTRTLENARRPWQSEGA